jgi:hypothetical protein
MPDYSKGKIYKLSTPFSNEVYYGSTVQLLSKRKGSHKEKYLKWKNTNINYMTSFKLFEYDSNEVCITLIENYSCNSKEELEARERYYIENNICVNKRIPQRTGIERYNDNKDIILKKNKEYYLKNKIKCDNYKKEHYEENKEHFNQYKKEWYQQNKERLKQKRNKETFNDII